MEIKVLGVGCSKCRTLLATVEKVVAEDGIDATVTKVDDMIQILEYKILSTPALVVDEQIVSEGKSLTKAEVRHLLTRKRNVG